MPEYIRIKDGKISDLISTVKHPSGNGWKKVPRGFGGWVGMKESWIDQETMRVKDEARLISEGIVKDTRGMIIFEKETALPFRVDVVDFEIPDTHTTKAPKTSADKWNNAKGKWTRSKAVEKKYKDTVKINKAMKILRDTQCIADEAVESGIPLAESDPAIYKMRKAARETIRRLQDE